ncbi:hypothetical protein KXV98_004450 [Aspergillus fumigatus]|nr:hypothetical protein KXV98_004450 [Aspergillus fumigatus]
MARSLLEEAQTSIQAGEHSAAPARMRVIVVLTSPTAVYEADLLAMVEFDLRASDAVVHTVSILDLRNHHQLSAPAFFGPLQRLLQDELHDSWAEAPSAWAALLGCPPEFPPASGTSARTSARSRTPHRLSPPHRRKTSVFRPEHVFDDLYRDLCHAARGIHGHPDPGHHSRQDLVRCLLCQKSSQLTVRQLPPTKRPVVVTLDGGGMRGMITLGLLRALERRLAGAVNTFAEIPDLIAGTSVGAVIGTDLAYNNASAAEAYEKFPDFARKAVSARRRLAIIVSRISDGKSCVFPNHRGVGGAGVDPTSQATVSSDLSQNPLLWEVVGAPWFFHCKHLPEFETLQNGGVRGNNHSGIAQEECRIIWPSAQTFDLLISSGQDMSRLSLRSTFRVNTLAAPYRTGLLYACGGAIRPPVWMVRKPSRKDSNTYRILCDLPASSRRRW